MFYCHYFEESLALDCPRPYRSSTVKSKGVEPRHLFGVKSLWHCSRICPVWQLLDVHWMCTVIAFEATAK